MTDKNGKQIKIGDKLRPTIEGVDVLAIAEIDTEEFGHCLLVQQILDTLAFSPLTQESLSDHWVIIEE